MWHLVLIMVIILGYALLAHILAAISWLASNAIPSSDAIWSTVIRTLSLSLGAFGARAGTSNGVWRAQHVRVSLNV